VKHGDTTILEVDELRLEGPGVYQILGPNGAGKTTLLRAIAGLIRLSHGEVRLGEHKVTKRIAWQLVSSNLAEPPLGFEIRVLDYARLYVGRLTPAWQHRVQSIFSTANLEWMLERRFSELSMGQASLAVSLVALARPTPLVVLDEPFSHLDPAWRCKLLAMLSRLARDRIIVYTTHEFETPRYANTLTLLVNGKVAAHGEPHNLLDTPGILERVYNTRFIRAPGCICGA